MPTIRYKWNAHQRDFQLDDESKFLHLSSGFGGGKSYAVVMKSLKLSRLNTHVPGGCVVPSIADFKKDLLPLYEEILAANRVRYRYHQTDKWFEFPWSRARLYVVSAEKKIRGPNWGWAVVNEAGLISFERYKETIGRVRLRNCPSPQIASSGTPEGKSNWTYEFFVEEPRKNSRIIFGNTRDNIANLSDEYIPTLESSYDQVMLDAYLRGLYVNMNGNRFYYSYDPDKNDDDSLERLPGRDVYVMLDFNVQPMVATLAHIVHVQSTDGQRMTYPDGSSVRRLVCFDQIVIENDATTDKMCLAFSDYGLDPDTTIICPDPAGNSRSTKGHPDNVILKNNGWHRVKTKSAAPQFRRRQLAGNNLLAKGLVQIHPKKCKALKKDFEAVETESGRFEKVKDNPKLTHASDGFDYLIDIEFPLSGHKPDSGVIKIR